MDRIFTRNAKEMRESRDEYILRRIQEEDRKKMQKIEMDSILDRIEKKIDLLILKLEKGG